MRVRQRAGYEAHPGGHRRGDGIGALEQLGGDVARGRNAQIADGILDDETYDWAAERSKQSRSPRVLGHLLSAGRKSDPPSRATELPELHETYLPHPFEAGSELLRPREELGDTSPQPWQLSLNCPYVGSSTFSYIRRPTPRSSSPNSPTGGTRRSR
jgi:hypothetical protein